MSSSKLDPAAVLRAPESHVVAPVTGVDELDEMTSLMARFTNGPAHEERRRAVVDALSEVDAIALRRSAGDRTRAARSVDLDPDVTDLARRVVVAELASAMGFTRTDDVVDALLRVAGRLAPRADAGGPGAQSVRSAVATLKESAPVADPVVRANLISALFQAVDATAGLVTNALQRAAEVEVNEGDVGDPERLIDETLVSDPPVQRTRRVLPSTGEVVVVPLTAGDLAFGTGIHECPGQSLARALAIGIVEAVLASDGVDGERPTYEDRWNLRIVDQQRLRRR